MADGVPRRSSRRPGSAASRSCRQTPARSVRRCSVAEPDQLPSPQRSPAGRARRCHSCVGLDQRHAVLPQQLTACRRLSFVYVLLGVSRATADEAGWAALRQPGAVALIRHARAPGTGDPPASGWAIARPSATCPTRAGRRRGSWARRCARAESGRPGADAANGAAPGTPRRSPSARPRPSRPELLLRRPDRRTRAVGPPPPIHRRAGAARASGHGDPSGQHHRADRGRPARGRNRGGARTRRRGRRGRPDLRRGRRPGVSRR